MTRATDRMQVVIRRMNDRGEAFTLSPTLRTGEALPHMALIAHNQGCLELVDEEDVEHLIPWEHVVHLKIARI